MNDFSFDETNLMCIYNAGTRAGMMEKLTSMRGYLEPDETDLRELTDSVLEKLGVLSDKAFMQLELVPDFGE